MDIEQQIQQKGANVAPRVTPADIVANIASVHYFTAAQGVAGEASLRTRHVVVGDTQPPAALSLLTFCVLVLRNGFTVTGESACASPENFDAEIGQKIAYESAKQKIWPLMGYALKERLAHGNSDARAAAGAVYDFAGYLTTREQAITMGATHNAAPAADACRAFLEMRGLGGTEPDVMGWSNLAAPADFRERVRGEKRELDERLGKLEAFIDSERFEPLPVEEKHRMRRQAAAMRDYSTILHERIGAFC